MDKIKEHLKQHFRWQKTMFNESILYYFIGGIFILGIVFYLNHPIEPNLPIMLSMKELGYSESILESVRSDYNEKYGPSYQLRIANSDIQDINYIFIEYQFNDYPDPETAYQRLKKIMIQTKQNEQDWLSSCQGNCIDLSSKDYTDIESLMEDLNPTLWNADKAFTMAPSEYYEKFIFLQKKNKLVIIKFNRDLVMTPEQIQVLNQLIDLDYSFILEGA